VKPLFGKRFLFAGENGIFWPFCHFWPTLFEVKNICIIHQVKNATQQCWPNVASFKNNILIEKVTLRTY
jgi:hypothetical protein